jgi:integrase
LEGRLTMNYYSEFFLRDYKGRKGRPSPRTMKEYTLHVENVIKPSWGRFFLDDLPVQKIMADLREIATTRPVQANRVHATLSAMCTWAIKCDDIAVNPFLGKTKPGEENRKQRALDFDMELREPVNSGEIKTVWNAFESIDRKYKFAIRMILLTGQRPGEVLSARWDHFVNGRWIIPDTKNKNGLHKLPITPMLQLLLDDLKGTSGKSDWLFPDGTTLRPLVSNQLAKIVRYEIANGSLIGMAPWTPHVLRHTVATHLGYIGFYDDEIGVLLNHSRPGITARYNHSDGLSRMGCMLESWQRRLVDILDGKRGDNVVRMR